MDNFSNPIASPEKLPYRSVETLPGVEIKTLNVKDKVGVWSVFVRLQPGSSLPAHQNDAMCEMFVIKGRGSYTQGGDFSAGDYIRENASTYPPMETEEESILFITHHGTCRFLNQDGTNRLTSDIAFFKAQVQQ